VNPLNSEIKKLDIALKNRHCLIHPELISYMRRAFRVFLFIFSISLSVVSAEDNGGAGVEKNVVVSTTYTNPIVNRGADPWVVQHGGAYYFCQSLGRNVRIAKASRIQDIGKGPWVTVWTPAPGTETSSEIWAPELHYVRGNWYVYVAADDGENAHHRMYVLKGTSQDPQAPFEMVGKIAAPTDCWAIDGTVLEMPGDRLYFIWSGWEGTENVAQNLYIAPMSDPATISGERVLISKPEYDWELRGKPLINEGPEVLRHGTNIFIIYSASGSWSDDYCLGQLSWTGGDVLKPESWVKKKTAVFSRTAEVFGPGHCSFVKSPDGTEDWIVFHSAKKSGAGWNRQVSMQRFGWDSSGAPDFGRPVAPGISLAIPSEARGKAN
jgi:GH43 family beta-xylosidase